MSIPGMLTPDHDKYVEIQIHKNTAMRFIDLKVFALRAMGSIPCESNEKNTGMRRACDLTLSTF